jgi:hypothetical protein
MQAANRPHDEPCVRLDESAQVRARADPLSVEPANPVPRHGGKKYFG